MVDVAADGLQTTEQECLTHHIEVARQRIHHVDKFALGIGLKAFIECFGCKRVAQDFVEAGTGELLADDLLQAVRNVGCCLADSAGANGAGEFHAIVSIDAEDVFDDVAVTGDIHTVGWNLYLDSIFIFGKYFHFEKSEDLLYPFRLNVDAGKRIDTLVRQINDSGYILHGINLLDVAYDGAACQFLDE